MYYDQNSYPDQDSYPDQSQGSYDSSVYQTQAYYDPNTDGDQSQSNYSILVGAQERLAREGYYRGETDGVLSPEMQKAVRRYQITNGLRATGYLDSETLGIMGLR
jgi:peptidoglycan hydrolase-like protein with peptidoglycan-binding domain